MERIGLANLLGNLFQAGCDNVAPIFGLLDLLGVFVGDVGDDALVGKFVNQSLLEDLVDLVTGQLHRRDRHCLAAGFLLQIGNGIPESLGLRFVAAGKVGDDDGAVGQLKRCTHQAAEAVNHHVGERALSKHLGAGVVKVRGQLVKQDQCGLVPNDFFPLTLVDRFGAIDPVGLNGLGFA